MRFPARQTADRTIADFDTALRRQTALTITYRKANGDQTVRTIEPLSISATGAVDVEGHAPATRFGNLVVVAMDRESGERRTWRLDRVLAYTSHRTPFTVPVPAGAVPSAVFGLSDDEMGELIDNGDAEGLMAEGDLLAEQADRIEAEGDPLWAARLWELADLAWQLGTPGWDPCPLAPAPAPLPALTRH